MKKERIKFVLKMLICAIIVALIWFLIYVAVVVDLRNNNINYIPTTLGMSVILNCWLIGKVVNKLIWFIFDEDYSILIDKKDK